MKALLLLMVLCSAELFAQSEGFVTSLKLSPDDDAKMEAVQEVPENLVTGLVFHGVKDRSTLTFMAAGKALDCRLADVALIGDSEGGPLPGAVDYVKELLSTHEPVAMREAGESGEVDIFIIIDLAEEGKYAQWFNLQLVARGWGAVLKSDVDSPRRKRLLAALEKASDERRGVWSGAQ